MMHGEYPLTRKKSKCLRGLEERNIRARDKVLTIAKDITQLRRVTGRNTGNINQDNSMSSSSSLSTTRSCSA